MKRTKYSAEFKTEAIKHRTDKGYSVFVVAKRLGIGDGILYNWIRKSKPYEERDILVN